MKKRILFLTLLLLSLLVLAACGGDPAEAEESEEVEVSEETEETVEPGELPESVQAMVEEVVEYSEDSYFTNPGAEDVSVIEDTDSMYVNNTLLLYAVDGTDAAAMESLAETFGATIVGVVPAVDLYQFQFGEAMDNAALEAMALVLEQSDSVESVTIDYVMELSSDVSFNDDWYDSENPDKDTNYWGIDAINAEGAWDYLDYMTAPTIGLMEGVTATDHPDLTIAGVTNLGTTGLRSAISSTVAGWSGEDHGTHVAGTMAAIANNGKGIAGVCAVPGTEVYVCNLHDALSVGAFMNGITKMVTEEDVQVINISQYAGSIVRMFAATQGNQDAIDAIENEAEQAETHLRKLLNKGYEFVLCMSAGNQNTKTFYETGNEKKNYGYKRSDAADGKTLISGVDAKYNHYLNCIEDEKIKSRIIVVGNAAIHDKTAANSNVGNRVDVMAPGTDIYSLTYEGGYMKKSGTSMAAPHVSGVAAMLFACNESFTGAQVKQFICDTANYNITYDGVSAGLLQADAAVEAALSSFLCLPSSLPTGVEFMQLHYPAIRDDYVWTDIWEQGLTGTDQTHTWMQLDRDAASYDFLFSGRSTLDDLDNACPTGLYITDGEGGDLGLAITDNVKTGMTWAEINAAGNQLAAITEQAGEFVTDLGGDYAIKLKFDGDTEDAVCIGASIEVIAEETVVSLPSLDAMMRLTREELEALSWDAYGWGSGDGWETLNGEYQTAVYNLHIADGDGYPYVGIVTDAPYGELGLPITDTIKTGMTYDEILAVEDVSDLELIQNSYGAYFYLEQGYQVILYFDGGAVTSRCCSAEIAWFE